MALFGMSTAEVARRLHSACTRLYSERRMDGDEMRDMAQRLQAVLDSMVDLELEATGAQEWNAMQRWRP